MQPFATAPPAEPPTSVNGLDAAVAAERLAQDGPNELSTRVRRGIWGLAADMLREPLFLLLLGAGLIYLVMGDAQEALVLLGFVLIIMAITVLQQRRTDRALDALRELSSPRALVWRDGVAVRIPGTEVVRGDVLVLHEGDRVPADGQLMEAHELAADESLLTGESEAVNKRAQDRLFAGALVVRGQGLLQVTAIGAHTELGRIGKSLESVEPPASPLRQNMARLTTRLVTLALVLSAGLGLLFWALRGDALQAVLASITLAMSLLPQELAVIMVVFLALAARRLARQQVLTRQLQALETLGQTTVLCVDKTGTLTQNRMAVAALATPTQTLDTRNMPSALPEAFHELLEYAVLASEIDAHDPMERAVHALAQGQFRGALANAYLHPNWDLAREYELSPELLAMTHLWRSSAAQHTVASKGAPEAVARLCRLNEEELAEMAEQAAQLADQGLRVLGVAKAVHPGQQAWPEAQHGFDFEWLGLIALADPIRPEVPDAVAQCQGAGIRVLMITGDHPRTARAIGAQAGIKRTSVITGDEMAALAPQQLAQRLTQVDLFARIAPQQKLALVQALRDQGEVVAMTGDGVNDAPALKAAHIGIAMGQRGTDVAREAAALVLLRDDFASIVHAIRSGRQTFANLRQAMVYILAVHVPIVALAALPLLLGLPLVLAPVHIAFLELVIDPACSLVFEAEQSSRGLMNQPPRHTRETLIAGRHVVLSVFQGLLVTVAVVAIYAGALGLGLAKAQAAAAAFLVLVAGNAVLMLPSRSAQTTWRSLWTGLPSVSVWVLLGTLAAVSLVTLLPGMARAFEFAALPIGGWLAALAVGLALVVPLQWAKQAMGLGWPAGK